MIIDPSDLESLKAFFAEYDWMTISQQAILVGRSISTIRIWRRRCGILPRSQRPHIGKYPPALTVNNILPKEVWDNKEWLEGNYKKHGTSYLGKLAGVSPATIHRRLKKYDIPIRKIGQYAIVHQCCNERWLYYHYSTKQEYSEWCKQNDLIPDSRGGMALNLRECAELAEVSIGTIVNWLTKFGIRMRNRSEAWSGAGNPMYGRHHKAATRRKIRDKYFEAYRKGLIQFPIGPTRFTNGKKLAPQDDNTT